MSELSKALIIGGSGFLGSKIASLLKEKKIEVVSIDIKRDSESMPDTYIETDLSIMTREQIEQLFLPLHCDCIIYALGPDDRTIVNTNPNIFFQEKLVDLTRKVLTAAKNVGISKAVVLGSYFEHFNEILKGKLEIKHPYIKARKEQATVVSALTDDFFHAVILELPYIFGIKTGTAPLWKEHFLDVFASFPVVFIPPQGGTAITTRNNVACAVYGALLYHDSVFIKLPLSDLNLSFKELLIEMLYSSGIHKKVVHLPSYILFLGTSKLRRKMKKENKYSGLHYGYLMTQIMNQQFFIPEKEYVQKLHLESLGLKLEEKILGIIDETMKYAYEKK
ncbi:MAG: NAD-dependent epimerase/dehydratase family protein [Candidatus Izemoplasmatales bacterium]